MEPTSTTAPTGVRVHAHDGPSQDYPTATQWVSTPEKNLVVLADQVQLSEWLAGHWSHVDRLTTA